MRYAIVDACFSEAKQASRGMSATYLAWELDRHGLQECAISDADCLLVTCQSAESAPFVATLRKRYRHKIIICGGAASTSPYSIGLHCDVVCVGDGQAFLSTLFRDGLNAASKLPNSWVHGEDRRVEIDYNYPWDMPPIQAEDGAYRVWCGRGCKHKCKFCPTGWEYKYSENPDPDKLVAQAKNILMSGDRVGYLSNDVMQHSFYSRLPSTEHGSYTVAYLRKHGLPPARQIRLGIEGVSERLRRYVSKPISRVDLIDCTRWLNANGKSVRWFMIAGLPTETGGDWLEIRDVIQEWKAKTPKGVLALSFTAFCPYASTPFATVALNDDYWKYYLDFKEWFFGGRGWSNRVKLMSPQAPENRMKKAVLALGLTEAQIREGGHISPNNRVVYPYEKQLARAKAHYMSQDRGTPL